MLTTAEISLIRQKLNARFADLTQRAERASEDASHRNLPLSADFSEQAVEQENDEVLNAIADESLAEAAQIKAALLRIDTGAYGLCEQCNEWIKTERLAAVPYAIHCSVCAR